MKMKGEWHPELGASESDVAKLVSSIPLALPSSYLELLRSSNGGEGDIPVNPLWFQLFDIDSVISLWRDTFYRTEYSSLFIFGSNGSGETIALDISCSQPWPVVCVDCIAGMESAEVIADSFELFFNLIGYAA